jgi:hypothetical protein
MFHRDRHLVENSSSIHCCWGRFNTFLGGVGGLPSSRYFSQGVCQHLPPPGMPQPPWGRRHCHLLVIYPRGNLSTHHHLGRRTHLLGISRRLSPLTDFSWGQPGIHYLPWADQLGGWKGSSTAPPSTPLYIPHLGPCLVNPRQVRVVPLCRAHQNILPGPSFGWPLGLPSSLGPHREGHGCLQGSHGDLIFLPSCPETIMGFPDSFSCCANHLVTSRHQDHHRLSQSDHGRWKFSSGLIDITHRFCGRLPWGIKPSST